MVVFPWVRGPRRPAAAVVVTFLVRWRRGSGPAGALPRLALEVVSERASTGRLGGALVWGLGLWLASDARICVGGLKAKASAFATGSRHQRRSVGPERTKGESWLPLGVGWAALLPSRGTVHEKGEALPRLTPPAVDMPPVQASEGGRSTAEGAHTQDRASTPSTDPQPETPDQRRRQPPGRGPFGAQDESKPRQRSPTRAASRTDAAAGRRPLWTSTGPPGVAWGG